MAAFDLNIYFVARYDQLIRQWLRVTPRVHFPC